MDHSQGGGECAPGFLTSARLIKNCPVSCRIPLSQSQRTSGILVKCCFPFAMNSWLVYVSNFYRSNIVQMSYRTGKRRLRTKEWLEYPYRTSTCRGRSRFKSLSLRFSATSLWLIQSHRPVNFSLLFAHPLSRAQKATVAILKYWLLIPEPLFFSLHE